MRIIRVSGCHDCWYCKSSFMVNDFYCRKIKMSVDKYVETETLPDNCPLEEVVQIITKIEIEKKFGSAK